MKSFFSFFKYLLSFRLVRAFKVVFGDKEVLQLEEFLEKTCKIYTVSMVAGASAWSVKRGLRKIYNTWENPEYFTVAGKQIDAGHQSRIGQSVVDIFGRTMGGNTILEPIAGSLADEVDEALKTQDFYEINGIAISEGGLYGRLNISETARNIISNVYQDHVLNPVRCPSCKSSSWDIETDDEGSSYCDECETPYEYPEHPFPDDYVKMFLAVRDYDKTHGTNLLEQ